MYKKSKKDGKAEKRRMLLEYAKKIYKRENRFVSKREIRKVFHVELYNYFKNIFDLYQHFGVDVPLCYCPKEYATKKIIEFVRGRSSERLYPTKTEITNDLKIDIYTYFKNIEDIYAQANIDFKLYKERENILNGRSNTPVQNKKNKERIQNYIREKALKGFFPGANQIQKELNLAFYKYFANTKEVYEQEGLNYERISPITLGRKKEKILTKIAMVLLEKEGYKIQRVSIWDKEFFNRGEDICALDSQNNKVLIELKAYRKDYNIIKREITQLHSYLIKQNVKKGIFITTSNKVNYHLPGIEIINGHRLIHLLKKHGLDQLIPKVRWIQQERVNLNERIEFKERKKREIIDFILKHSSIPTKKEIEDKLHIDMRSYFKTNCFEQLIKEIKNKFSNDSVLLYTDHQQKLQCI